MLVVLAIAAMGKDDEPRNKVHFYVARDKNDELFLYVGKPFRDEDYFKGVVCLHSNCFEDCNLDKNDFDNLKWEDEPVEVFLNLEDWVWN